MIPTIHVLDHLSFQNLDHILEQFKWYHSRGYKELLFYFDSYGGNGIRTKEVIDEILRLQAESDMTLRAHIKVACSGAALFAMCIGQRTIDWDGRFEIHLGALSVEAIEIHGLGYLNKKFIDRLQNFADHTLQQMRMAGIRLNPKEAAKLYASGSVSIPPVRLVELGFATIRETQQELGYTEEEALGGDVTADAKN
jgi:hypothetical protein